MIVVVSAENVQENKMIKLYDGKYGVINNNGTLEIYRNGERWEAKEKDYIGDGFVLSLVQKIEDLIDNGKKEK